MELTSDNVQAICKDVLYKDSEIKMVDGEPVYSVEPVIVPGVVNAYGFHPQRLQSHARDIRTMLLQLPSTFFVSIGGGWSFLNLCVREDGFQWTGLHQVQEQLCCMGIALGMATWVPNDRKLWGAMPGNVPYFQIDLSQEKKDDGVTDPQNT